MFEKERRQKFKVKHDIPLVRVLTAIDNNTLLRGREGSLCTDVPSSLRKKSGEETFPEGGGDVCTQARGGKRRESNNPRRFKLQKQGLPGARKFPNTSDESRMVLSML